MSHMSGLMYAFITCLAATVPRTEVSNHAKPSTYEHILEQVDATAIARSWDRGGARVGQDPVCPAKYRASHVHGAAPALCPMKH